MANLYTTWQSGLAYEFFNAQQFPRPTGLAIVLLGPVPTNTQVVEVANAAGYARQGVPQNAANWSYPYPNSGLMTNINQITFPVCTAYLGWVSGIAVSDSLNYGAGILGSGSILFYGTISPAKELAQNDQLYIPALGLTCQFS